MDKNPLFRHNGSTKTKHDGVVHRLRRVPLAAGGEGRRGHGVHPRLVHILHHLSKFDETQPRFNKTTAATSYPARLKAYQVPGYPEYPGHLRGGFVTAVVKCLDGDPPPGCRTPTAAATCRRTTTRSVCPRQ